jgi:hypothetical protein
MGAGDQGGRSRIGLELQTRWPGRGAQGITSSSGSAGAASAPDPRRERLASSRSKSVMSAPAGIPKSNRSPRYWWLVLRRDDIEVCLKAPPGRDVDVVIAAGLGTFTKVWLGYGGLVDAIERARISLHGSRCALATACRLLAPPDKPTLKHFRFSAWPPLMLSRRRNPATNRFCRPCREIPLGTSASGHLCRLRARHRLPAFPQHPGSRPFFKKRNGPGDVTALA